MTPTDRRWTPQKALPVLITLVMILVPIGAAVLAATVLANTLPEPTTTLGVVLWWIAVLGISFFAAWLADNVMRRFAPMAGLWKMTLVFPDKAPSRFRIALRSTNVSELRRRINQAGSDVDLATSAETILALATALSAHDRKTRGHSERTRAYTDLIADELDLSEADTDRLRWAALLHDIGKLEIPEEILNKDGPLTSGEFAQIKRHPILGMEIAAPLLPWLGNWADTIADHHEKWDGSGYPRGLRGEEISLGGRVVAVADSYDVMTSGRSYQSAKSPEVARREIVDMAGSQFDPVVARALMSVSIGKLTWLRPMGWFASIPFVGGLDRILRDAGTVGSAAALTLVLLVTGLLPGLGDEGTPSIDPATEVVASEDGPPATQPPSTRPVTATQPPPPPTTPPSNPVTTPPPATVPPVSETTTTTTTTTAPDTTPGTTFPLELTTTTSSTTTTSTTTTSTAPTITASPPPTTLPLQPNPDNATVVAGHEAVTVRPLSNDTGNDLVLASLEGNELGEVKIGEGRASFTYLAHDGATGLDDFDYGVCDVWDRCATEAISIRVTAPPQPILNPNELEVLAGDVAVVDVLADDNGQALTITDLRTAAGPAPAAIETDLGEVKVLADETIEYRAKKSVAGVDELVYTVCDNDSDCAQSNLTIILDAQPQPITEGDNASVRSGETIVVDVLANDNGDELALSEISDPPEHGEAAITSDQRGVRYRSARGFAGEDVFVYGTCDRQGDCAAGRVRITVEAPPAPDARPDEGQVEAGKVTVISVLGNDVGSALTVRSIDQGATNLGEATINNNARSIRYAADMEAGTDEFSYQTCDPFDRCSTAQVRVAVTPRRVPHPQPDTTTVELGHSVVIDVLANDSGDGLIVQSIVSQPKLGSVEIADSQTVRYEANPDDTGRDSFRYRVCDDDGDCASAPVSVRVRLPDLNTYPDVATVLAGEKVVIDVLGNDDGDSLDIRRLDEVDNSLGRAVITGDRVEYRAHPSVKGQDTFQYRVCDRHGTCDQESVNVTVDPQPEPATQPDKATVNEGDTVEIAVLANDNGDGLTVQNTRNATRGQPTITPDGTRVRYSARDGESGIDQFQYQACDLDGDCVWGTITVTVVPNRPPTAVDDWVEGPPGAVRTVDVVTNDSDPDNDPLELVEITMPPDPYAQASIVNGQIRVDLSNRTNPPQNRNTEIISYRVCDPDGLCTQGQLIVRLVRRWDTGSDTPTVTPGGWWGADLLNNGRNFKTEDPISGSPNNEGVYQSEQYGPEPADDNQRPRSYGYQFQVSPGRWRVRLHFAELWWNANGQRVFDVFIDGQQKLDDLDIHAVVGHDAAHREAFDVTVADGNINIRFDASIDNASIVGIELIPMHETLFEVATRRGTKPR